MDSAQILKALSDETRIGIVRFLLNGKKSAGDIVKSTKKSQPNSSLAIKQLLLTGIVMQEKDGRQIFYSLRRPEAVKKMLKIVEELQR